MIEILSYDNSPSEAKAKCLVAETLLTNENVSVNIVARILSIIGVRVKIDKLKEVKDGIN